MRTPPRVLDILLDKSTPGVEGSQLRRDSRLLLLRGDFLIIKADSSRVWLSRIVQSACRSLLHNFADSKQETCDGTDDFVARTHALAVLPLLLSSKSHSRAPRLVSHRPLRHQSAVPALNLFLLSAAHSASQMQGQLSLRYGINLIQMQTHSADGTTCSRTSLRTLA